MTRRVQNALESHGDDYEIRDQLHDVPPYEVYEVVVDGRRAVCKVDAHPRADAATEGAVQAYVARTTPTPVPDVLAVGDDHYLAAWREDVPPQGGDPGVTKARTMGAAMARFHEATSFDAPGLPTAAGGRLAVDECPDWPAAVDALLADLQDYVAAQGHGDAVARVRDFVAEDSSVFESPEEPVLCHGNWLPEHVGVDPGGTTPAPAGDLSVPGAATCVIDFEHALVAPPEYDVWRSLLPLSGAAGLGEAFREGYEAVRPLPEGSERRAPCYRLVNAVQYLESLYLQDQHGEVETERKAERFRAGIDDLLAELRERT
jgi:fructosamine-3-kinase